MKQNTHTSSGASRRLFIEWLKPFQAQIALHLATLVLVTLVQALVPYFTGALVDRVTSGDISGAFQAIGYAAAATLVSQVLWLTWWRRDLRCFERELPRSIERRGLDLVARFSLGQCKGENSAFRRTVMLEGQRALVTAVNLIGFELAPAVAKAVIYTVAITWTSPTLGGIAAIASVLYIWYSVEVNRRYRPSLESLDRVRTRVAKFTSEHTRHIPDAMAAAQELRLNREVEERSAAMHGDEVTFWSRHMYRMNLRDVVLNLVRFGVLALAATYAVNGKITGGSFVAVLTWHAIMCDGLGRIGMVARQWIMAVVQLDRYARMLSVPPAVKVNPNAVPRKVLGKIEFRNVTFRYPEKISFEEGEDGEGGDAAAPSEPVLRGVSFSVNPGETLALVGASGAGKSTIVDLLLRGYDPNDGKILVDGVNLRDFDLVNFRRQVGYVPQDIVLYDGTLRENVRFCVGDEPVPEERMERTLQASRVRDFLPSMGPEGLDRRIGERGARLSGGQRQRVGIARALLGDPRILILDEATSNLDAKNEGDFYRAVFEDEQLKAITRIVIAHRLGTIRRADKIVFLEKGQVIDVGSHAELVRRCAPYQALVREQAYTVVLDSNGSFVDDGVGEKALSLAADEALPAVATLA